MRSPSLSIRPSSLPTLPRSSPRSSPISFLSSIRVDLSSTLTSRISPLTSRKPSSMCTLRSSRRSSVHDSLAMTAMVATVDRKPHTDCAQNVNFLCLAWDQTVNRTFDGGEIEAVLVVFAEGRGAFDGGAEDAVSTGPLQVRDEAAQLPLAEVGVDV